MKISKILFRSLIRKRNQSRLIPAALIIPKKSSRPWKCTKGELHIASKSSNNIDLETGRKLIRTPKIHAKDENENNRCRKTPKVEGEKGLLEKGINYHTTDIFLLLSYPTFCPCINFYL